MAASNHPLPPGTWTSKIARLPYRVRDEVCRRLDRRESATTLLAWLNALPAVQAVLIEQFASVPVSVTNLATWRNSGYQLWRSIKESSKATTVRRRPAKVGGVRRPPGAKYLAQKAASDAFIANFRAASFAVDAAEVVSRVNARLGYQAHSGRWLEQRNAFIAAACMEAEEIMPHVFHRDVLRLIAEKYHGQALGVTRGQTRRLQLSGNSLARHLRAWIAGGRRSPEVFTSHVDRSGRRKGGTHA